MTAQTATSPGRRGVPFREVEIDLAQLAENLGGLRSHEVSAVFADVGANAWGHGIDVVVPALSHLGVQCLVVARRNEAEHVRALAPQATIVTTQHPYSESFDWMPGLRVTPAVRSRREFDRAIAAGVGSIVLTEDDGASLPALEERTRRACADEAGSRGVTVVEMPRGSVLGPELFGVFEDDEDPQREGCHPVLRLWGPVAATKRVGADEGVSYGYIYHTSGVTTLALVTLGYSDGISRSGGNLVPVSLVGRTSAIAGRVAMDAFMLDLGNVPAPALGVAATVLGDARRDEPTAAGLGKILGMSSAEITTRLTARPHRYGSGGAV